MASNPCAICDRPPAAIPARPEGLAVCRGCVRYLVGGGLDGAERRDGGRVWSVVAWEILKH